MGSKTARCVALATGVWFGLGYGSRPAFAQAPQSDDAAAATAAEVHLKDGRALRGTLLETVPGVGVRVRSERGDVVTVPWNDVARIETVEPNPTPNAQSPPPATPSAAPPPSVPASPSMRSALVHIDSSTSVTLQGRIDEDYEWMDFCRSPCDKLVRTDWQFRIVGDGVKPSETFDLGAAGGGRIVLTVKPASKSWSRLGVVAVVLGGLVALVGASNVESESSRSSDTGPALGALGIGLGLTVAGVVALVTNSSTDVDQRGERDAHPDSGGMTRWREPTFFDRGMPKPLASATLLRVTF